MSPLRTFLLIGLLFFSFAAAATAQETRTHIVKRGETLYRISRQYEMSVDQLRRLNSLTGNVIKPGQVLVVVPPDGDLPPLPPPPSAQPARTEPAVTTERPQAVPPVTPIRASTSIDPNEEPDPNAGAPKDVPRAKRTYIVQPGDTYYSVAIKYGVPAYAIFALNKGQTGPLEPNQPIWIPDTSPIQQENEVATVTRRRITVKKGDTLYGIAGEFKVTVAALKAENGLTSNTLSIGQELVIPEDEPAPEPEQLEERLLPPLYQVGRVLPYQATYAGRLMASGKPYEPSRYTVSHPDLSLESVVLLTNIDTGQMTFAEVTDRGPVESEAYIMDVSEAAAKALGVDTDPDATIQVRVVE